MKFVLGLIAGFGFFACEAEACGGIGIDPRLAAICNLHALNTTPQTLETLARTHQALTRIGFRDGIQLFPPDEALDLQIAASPTLSFSENINGGMQNETLEVAGFSFSPKEDQISESGWLYGFELGAYGSYILGRGNYIDFQAAASTQITGDYDLRIDQFRSGGCGHFHLGSWRYVDICGKRRIEEKDLLSDSLREANVSFSKLWSTGSLSYRLALGVSSSSFQSGRHNTSTSVESEFIGFNGSGGGFRFELINGNMLFEGHDYRARLWIGDNIRDRPFQAFADFISSYEGEILGVDRIDKTAQLGVTYAPQQNWVVSFGLKKIDSSVEYFSNVFPFFSVKYNAFHL